MTHCEQNQHLHTNYSLRIILICMALCGGCNSQTTPSLTTIISTSLQEKKPVLLYLYQKKHKCSPMVQNALKNDSITSSIKNRFLFYQIDSDRDSYFPELLYAASKNFFVVLHGDSIVSVFPASSLTNMLYNQINHYEEYSFVSQAGKFSLLNYSDTLIGQTVNKIFRLQYAKACGHISGDEFRFDIEETIKDMPYFYNKYLLADMALDKGENLDVDSLMQLSRLEQLVYLPLQKEFLLKKNHVNPFDYAQVKYDCLVHDFGEVQASDTVNFWFHYRNVGKTPYIIYNVRTSCHCTASKWSRKPTLLSKQDSIRVSFMQDTPGKFNKTIYVKGNSQQDIVLRVKGEVIPR